MIIAIDFDGTITTGDRNWPLTLRNKAQEVINKLYNEGHELIIWTCRCGDLLEEAKEFLKEKEIKYHHINEESPTNIEKYGIGGRKIYADIYIDDLGILGVPEWSVIYEIIKCKLKNN